MVPMSAAALLDRLGRPGDIRLGSTRPERVARLSTGLAALEPEAAAAAGIALARLLWVRPRGVSDAFRAAEILLGAGGFGLVVLDVDASRTATGVWPRLARAAERTGSALLVVAPRREAGTL